VHLTPNIMFAKMQTCSCSRSNLTFLRNIWIFFEQQYNLKFDMLCPMSELVRGIGLFLVWCQKLFCMHVHKELMPCKSVSDVKSGIEPGLLARTWTNWSKSSAPFCQFLKPLKIPDTDDIIRFCTWMLQSFILAEKKFEG